MHTVTLVSEQQGHKVGGVYGEFTTVVMYPDRYGVDLGHGSATAILAYFNSAANLKMLGIEINDMR